MNTYTDRYKCDNTLPRGHTLYITYNLGNHWILLVISAKNNTVWYMDLNRPINPIAGERVERDYMQ